jgi:integrase
MSENKKVRYLKVDRGRFYYQRRIPKDLEHLLGEKVWRKPCGDVSFSKAVQLVVSWSEVHDQFIQKMKSDDARDAFVHDTQEELKKIEDEFFNKGGRILFLDHTGEIDGEEILPWKWALNELNELENLRAGKRAPKLLLNQIRAQIDRIRESKIAPLQKAVPPYPEVKALISSISEDKIRQVFSFEKTLPESLSNGKYLFELEQLFGRAFGDSEKRPEPNTDDYDEFEFVRKKIERKISSLKPNPNTISAVSERYFAFNRIRPQTQNKYRREISRLILSVGDIPIGNVEASHLKEMRDRLITQMLPASLHAVFTPIKGMFNYAIQEGLIEYNPIASVALPKDKRPIEERKWKKFEPEEVERIHSSLKTIWGNDIRGLSYERRDALIVVVRTLMFTGMRPIEVLRLTPSDINDMLIRINGSKTDGSTRVIPLHPELSDLPEWIRNGGLKTFETINNDLVASVRYNFSRLLRELMNPPILDRQKTLYSFRTTFVNAMRRAGADIQMQRAILGHKEAGAIRHYDDGPEFSHKYEMVARTDPRL